MKVLFLDFDGVLNSEASFRYETRRNNQHVSDTLSVIACSNLQYIMEQDSSVKVIITSTWRKLHTLVELKNILNAFGAPSVNIIGKTPVTMDGDRGHEIRMWLDANPGITKFVVLDDDGDAASAVIDQPGHFFQTTPDDGLSLKQAKQIAKLFREAQ